MGCTTAFIEANNLDDPNNTTTNTIETLIFVNDANQHPHDDYHSFTTHNKTNGRHDAYDDRQDDTYHNDAHETTDSYHDLTDNDQGNFVHDDGYHSS